MEIATWIIAICSIISLPISIWAIISSRKNDKKLSILQDQLNITGNNINIGNANNNGRDGVHVGK